MVIATSIKVDFGKRESMPDFLPRREAELVQWLGRFGRAVADDPARVGVPREMAERLVDLQRSYAAAYANCQNATRRTPTELEAKDGLRAAAAELARGVAAIVRAHPGMNDVTKIELGLKPRKKKVRQIPAPDVSPSVRVESAFTQTIRLRLVGTTSTGRCGKPIGADGAMVFLLLEDGCSPDEGGRWQFAGMVGRALSDFTVPRRFTERLRFGDTVWIAVRWQSPTGELGPMSVPIRMAYVGQPGLPGAMSA